MKAGVVLILMLTISAGNADNEGPSEVLKATWSQIYQLYRKALSRRCVRSCDLDAVDVYWNHTLGHAAQITSESTFMKSLIDAYTHNKELFITNIHRNITLATQSLDADNNKFISAEEFYTEFLCLGFGLGQIKKVFQVHHPVDKGIPISDFIADLVMRATDLEEGSEMHQLFDEFQNELS